MTLSYDTIFEDFLGGISDYQIASLDISDAYSLMTEYLHKALAKSYLRRIFSLISLDDEIQTITFTLVTIVDDGSDLDFVKNIIAKGMTVEWLEPQVKKTSLLHQMITSSKESKFYAQSSHISELRALLSETKNDVRNMIRDRGYIYNTYLEDK